MHEKGWPKEYWAKATNIVVFLLNKLPTKDVDGKTPFKAWNGFKPSMKNLKIFGCLCFTHCWNYGSLTIGMVAILLKWWL